VTLRGGGSEPDWVVHDTPAGEEVVAGKGEGNLRVELAFLEVASEEERAEKKAIKAEEKALLKDS